MEMDTQEFKDTNIDRNIADYEEDSSSDNDSDSENTAINIGDCGLQRESKRSIEISSLSGNSAQSIVCGCVFKKDIYHVGGCFLLVLVALGITGIYILYQGTGNICVFISIQYNYNLNPQTNFWGKEL